jgi:hypothetical protein
LTRVRQEQLKTLVDSAVGKALSLGYTADEIREAFDVQMTRWARRIK